MLHLALRTQSLTWSTSYPSFCFLQLETYRPLCTCTQSPLPRGVPEYLNIGTKFLFWECFGHNSTHNASFSLLNPDLAMILTRSIVSACQKAFKSNVKIKKKILDFLPPEAFEGANIHIRIKKSWFFAAGDPLGGQHPPFLFISYTLLFFILRYSLFYVFL